MDVTEPADVVAHSRASYTGLSPGLFRSVENAVEIGGGADERQMRECLGEIAQVFAARAQLFRVQPEMVGVADHLVELQTSFVHLPGPGQALDQPKGAGRKAAFAAIDAIGSG